LGQGFSSACSAVEAERVFAEMTDIALVIISSRIAGGEGSEDLGYSPNYHNDRNLDPLNGTLLASRLLAARSGFRILFLAHRVRPEVVLETFLAEHPGFKAVKALPERPESEEFLRAIQELLSW